MFFGKQGFSLGVAAPKSDHYAKGHAKGGGSRKRERGKGDKRGPSRSGTHNS